MFFLLNKKLVKSMKEEMRKNEDLKLVLDKLVEMGMSEEEGLDFMISAWVIGTLGRCQNE